MQQAVDAAQVDEGAVLGDVLHHAPHDLALRQAAEGAALLLGVLLLEDRLAGQDDVAALAVHLDDPHLQLFPLHGIQVAHRAQVHEGAGQEGAHADVHGQAALDPFFDDAGDGASVGIGPLDLLPHLHLLGLLLGKDHVAVLVLGLFQEHVDLVTHLDVHLPVRSEEFVEVDDALRLVPYVDDDLAAADAQHAAAHDLALGQGAQGLVVHLEELFVLAAFESGVNAVHHSEAFGPFGLGRGGQVLRVRVKRSKGGIVFHLLQIHAGRYLLVVSAGGCLVTRRTVLFVDARRRPGSNTFARRVTAPDRLILHPAGDRLP